MATIDNNIAQLTVKDSFQRASMSFPFINAIMIGEKEKLCNCWKIFLTTQRTIIAKTTI